MNNVVKKFKKGHKIHIKESLKGTFTKYCGGNVTNECILRGKNSPNPKIRRKATFADNARHFKHHLGGSIVDTQFVPKFNFKQGGIIKVLEGTKLTFGLKINNWFNSDLGQTITNGVSLLFNGILLANNLNKLNDRLQKWKLAYINSIEPEDFSQLVELEEEQLKLANPDYNSSPIVTAHKKWFLENQALNSVKQKAALEADMIIQLQLSNQLLSSGGGFNIGNMILTGLGIFGSLLGNKKLATSV